MILYNEYQIIPTLCQKVFQDNQTKNLQSKKIYIFTEYCKIAVMQILCRNVLTTKTILRK